MMQETYESPKRDDLFAASQIMPVVADKITVAKAGEVKRGTLLTAAGAVATAAADVYGVLAETVDTTDSAKEAAVYLTGEFNETALTVGGSITVADCKAAARKIGIFIKKNLTA